MSAPHVSCFFHLENSVITPQVILFLCCVSSRSNRLGQNSRWHSEGQEVIAGLGQSSPSGCAVVEGKLWSREQLLLWALRSRAGNDVNRPRMLSRTSDEGSLTYKLADLVTDSLQRFIPTAWGWGERQRTMPAGWSQRRDPRSITERVERRPPDCIFLFPQSL